MKEISNIWIYIVLIEMVFLVCVACRHGYAARELEEKYGKASAMLSGLKEAPSAIGKRIGDLVQRKGALEQERQDLSRRKAAVGGLVPSELVEGLFDDIIEETIRRKLAHEREEKLAELRISSSQSEQKRFDGLAGLRDARSKAIRQRMEQRALHAEGELLAKTRKARHDLAYEEYQRWDQLAAVLMEELKAEKSPMAKAFLGQRLENVMGRVKEILEKLGRMDEEDRDLGPNV